MERTYIVYMRCDLLRRICQRIKGFIDFLTKDLILHGNNRVDKDIVESLGFNTDVELLHTERKLSDKLLHGAADEIKSWLDEAGEASPLFNNPDFSSRNDKAAWKAHDVGQKPGAGEE